MKKGNKLLLITVPPHFCHFIFVIRSCLFLLPIIVPPSCHHALAVSHQSDLLVLSRLSQTQSLEKFKVSPS